MTHLGAVHQLEAFALRWQLDSVESGPCPQLAAESFNASNAAAVALAKQMRDDVGCPTLGRP
jgi:hypothetical protein